MKFSVPLYKGRMIVRAPASRRSRPPAQEVDLVDNKLTEKTVEKLLQTSHWEREPHKNTPSNLFVKI